MGRKLTQEEAEQRVKEKGFELLEKYKGKKQKIKFRCHCGKEFYSTLHSVLKSKSCGCSRKNKVIKKQNIYIKIIDLYNNGFNKKQTARELKIKLSTVNWCYHKYNLKTKDYHKENHPNWTGYGEICGSHFARIKHGAETRNLEFNITIEQIWELFLKQKRKCALSGVILDFKTKSGGTASLDRMDNSKGYIINNIQWIHKDINIMKMKLNNEEFIKFCHQISNYNKKRCIINKEQEYNI